MGQAAANFTGDIVGGIFGDEKRPGVFGTGQQRFDAPQMGQPKRDANGNPVIGDPVKRPYESDSDFNHRRERWLFEGGDENGDIVYETDPYKTWQDPMAEQRRGELTADKTKYENRQLTGDAKIDRGAIERFSGTSIPDAERYGGARVGAYERGQAAQLSPAERVQAERVGNIDIGQANVYGGAQIDPAAQARAAQLSRQDAEFRGGQTRLMGQLEEQAAGRGPSLAAGQLREATDRNLAQQAGAAAAGGGSAGLARRQLATGAAQANQQAGRDAAQMRIQEQMAARQQLQGVAQTGREQDINVANAQAQLQQQTSLANQAAINSRAGQQAGLTQQAGLAGAESLNARQYQQASLNAQLALANQGVGMQAQLANQQAGNQFALQQGQFGQQMNMANMEQYNQRQALQAQMYQQAGLQNSQQQNQFTLQQGAWAQQAGLANQQYSNQALFANQQAALQNQQMNDQMARYYTEAGLGLDARQQQAMMAYQKQQQETALGYAGLEQKAYEGAREGQGGMMSGIGSMLGAMSDEEVKGSVTRGDSNIANFLEQYGSNESADQALASTEKKSDGGLFGGMASGAAMSGMASGGGMAAMSDQKAKDLSNQNDKLKAQMVGMSMQNMGGHGAASKQGFFGGMAQGVNAKNKADAAMAAQKPAAGTKKVDPSSTMTPVMNNPNAAIAVPGFAGAQAMSPSYGGLMGGRENPYGAPPAQQTWGVSPPEPVYTPPPAGNMEITHMDPYQPMQTWSDKSMKEYSPAGMKTGIGSGNMQISNFLKSTEGAGSGPSNPTDYGEMSDKSTKKEIDEAIDDKISNFLNTQEAYEYEYKDKYKNLPGAGQGRFVSPMAQDLQKTELGKSMVSAGPDGKLQVDYGKGFGTILAAQAYLQERLNELEATQSPKKGKK